MGRNEDEIFQLKQKLNVKSVENAELKEELEFCKNEKVTLAVFLVGILLVLVFVAGRLL